MKFGIDLDDTIANFIPVFRQLCRDRFGVPESNIAPRDWGWSNFGLTLEQRAEVWKYIEETRNFHMSLKPLPNTELLRELDDEHNLYFITARKPTKGLTTQEQTRMWLLVHYGITEPAIVCTSLKTEACKEFKLDAMIDDRAETCEDIYKYAPDTMVYIKDAPHNRKANPEIVRVKHFNEFAALYL